MQPYRAAYQPNPESPPIPVIVVAALMRPPMTNYDGSIEWPGVMLLAVRQDTGMHLECAPQWLTVTEPSYLGHELAQPDHEHDWAATGGKPVLDGARLAGVAFDCLVDGCSATILRTAGKGLAGALGGVIGG